MAKKTTKNSNEIIQNNDNLSELLNSSKKNVDALKDVSKNSEELNLLYKASQEILDDMNQKMQEMSSNVADLANEYGVSTKEMEKALDIVEQYREVQKEIKEINNNSNEELKDNIERKKELIQLEKQLKKSIKENETANQLATNRSKKKANKQGYIIALRNEIRSGNEEIKNNKQDGQKVADNSKKEKDKEKVKQGINWANVFLSFLRLAYGKLSEVDQAARDFGRHMGMSNQEMNAHRTAMINRWGNMAKTLGMEFKEMYKFQTNYAEATERATVLTDQQVGSFAALSRVVGDTAISVATQSLDTMAASADAVIAYLAKGKSRATMEGLLLTKYSEAFAKNIKLASRFTFKEGITGVQKMTLLSQRLKFDMQSIASSMEKFTSIESAIETSAQIQVLGGSFANNFSNPLEAMAESLMDAEAFTKRIVSTVGNAAVFNRKTGEFDMPVVDKMRIKEYSKILGINYDEVFNMATQQQKIEAIKQDLGGQQRSEEELAWMANKGQYDTKTQTWQFVDAAGVTHNLTGRDAVGPEQLNVLRQVDTNEKMLNRNVDDIKRFLIGDASDQKSLEESWKGRMEQYQMFMGSLLNKVYGQITAIIPILVAIQLSRSLGIGMGNLGGMARGSGGILKSGWKGLTASSLPQRVASAKFNAMRGLKTAAPVAIAMGAIEAGMTYSEYKSQEEFIKKSSMTIEEKAQALNDAKKDKNKGYGGAAGGALGGILGSMAAGAVAGSIIPGIGNIGGAIVGLIGGVLGAWGGSSLGEMVGSSDLVNESVEETKQELEAEQQSKSSKKTETAKASVAAIGKVENSVDVVANKLDTTNKLLAANLGGTATAISNQYSSSSTSIRSNDKNALKLPEIKVNDMKINLNGSIKLIGDGKDVDINKLIANSKFKESIEKIVSDAFKLKPNGGVSPIQTTVS